MPGNSEISDITGATRGDADWLASTGRFRFVNYGLPVEGFRPTLMVTISSEGNDLWGERQATKALTEVDRGELYSFEDIFGE